MPMTNATCFGKFLALCQTELSSSSLAPETTMQVSPGTIMVQIIS